MNKGRYLSFPNFILFFGWLLISCGVLIADDRPNFLLFFIDDLKPMTADYGHGHMHTPNFDRLAASGIRFENAYCPVPTCGASRASLLTSLYPTKKRFPDFLTRAERDAPDHPTLPQKFKEAGYHTISNGKIFHHHLDAEERSWSEPAWKPKVNGVFHYNDETDAFMETVTETRGFKGSKNRRKKVPMFEKGKVDPMETSDGMVTAKTLADLKRMSENDKPFFIASGLAKPHMPFYSPEGSYRHYPLDEIQIALHRERPQPTPKGLREVKEQFAYLPMTHDFSRRLDYNSDDYHRHMRQGYYANVSHADWLLGRVLDQLDSLGLAENTIVAVLGDHGFLLGEHNQWAKNQLLHGALRTAMWMKGPGVEQGKAVDSFVEFVDIYPTFCELAGIDLSGQVVHGKSFTKVLQNPGNVHRKNAYTRFEEGDALTSKESFFVSWRKPGRKEALLLDRKQDPSGKTNQADVVDYRETRKTLQQALDDRIAIAESALKPISVSNRPLEIRATIEHNKPNGVVLAQGGYRYGYALTVVGRKPLVAVRNDGKLVQVQSEQPISGRVNIGANITAEKVQLLVDGKVVAEKPSPGLLLAEPAGELFHSEDRGDLVGKYPQEAFNGRLLTHSVK